MGWIPNAVGIIGVVLILLAYCLLQANKYSSSDLRYLKLNIVGSAAMLYSLYFNWNLASVIVEVIWFIISVWGIFRSIRQRESVVQL